MNQLLRLSVLVIIMTASTVYAGGTFMHPSSWGLMMNDDDPNKKHYHYKTFTEDSGHVCNDLLKKFFDCTESKGYTFDQNGYALRGCGYGQHCSASEKYHAGIDYEVPNHIHDPVDYENGQMKEMGLRQGSGGMTLNFHGEVDDIKASNDGVVTFSNENTDKGFGKTVILRHICNPNTPNIQNLCVPENGEWGIYTQYSHMSSITVSNGEAVIRGQKIGEIGGTKKPGEGWIHHLHFEFKTRSEICSPDNTNHCGYAPGNPTDYGYRDPMLFLGKVYIDDASDGCTTNSDGGQTCIIGPTTHIIHPNYRCSNNQCWQPGGETNCWDGNLWYEINNGNVSSITRYRDRNMCAEVYSADTLPVPEDPNIGNDDGYVDPVASHTHAIGMHSVRYQLPGQDNYHYGTATVEQGTDQNLDIRIKVEEKEGWSWKNVCVDLYYSDNHWFKRSHDQLIDTKCFDSLAPNASESKYFENLALKDLDQGHHYFFADIRYGYDHNISSNEDDSEYVVVDVVKPNGIPNGFIDTASCSSVDGWASDPDTASPLNVHIYKSNADGSNKTFIMGILADRYRADVGIHSFSWAIPESLKTGNAYTLYFYAINQPEGNNPLIGQKNILCANPAASLLPAYRLFNTSVGAHFYTISEAEKNSILQNYVWRAEGVAFYAHYKLEQYAVPIYRFNQRGRGHFYTASDAEKNSLMSNTAWTYEGVVFFAYTWQVAGSKPVYRMYSAQRMAHFYTTSWQEVQSAGASGYAYEGIGFYAF